MSKLRSLCMLQTLLLFTLTALGGDWVRDDKGKHRAFLMGESSRDTDEYTNKED